MRLTATLFTAAALLLTLAPAARADSIQLSVDSSVYAYFTSPSSSWWGTYDTLHPSTYGFASTGPTAAFANFASVSLFVPEGNVITSATMRVVVPSTPIYGTGFLFPLQNFEAPSSGPSVAPTFNASGTSLVFASFVDSLGYSSPLMPIINGNEVSTGDLSLLMNFGAIISDTLNTPGSNWYGYIGGNGHVDIPYTVQLNVIYSPVPEPSSIALLGTGVLGIAGFARRRFLSQSQDSY